jgi:polyisoprenoid-binding protein YceI
MKRLTAFAMIAGLSFFALPASAADYAIDPVHTQVMFSVSHLGFSHSHGRFADVTGSFSFDEKAPAAAAAEVKIATASLRMDDNAWEEHLKSGDFFNVAQLPEMTFKTTAVEVTGEKTGRVTGDLTLLGVTRPVTLDVTYNKGAVHPMSKKFTAGFSARGTLKRSDFGMTYGRPGVGDEVALLIEVEGTQKGAAGE